MWPPPVVGGNGGIGFHGAANETLPLPMEGRADCIGLVDAFACVRARLAKIAPRTTTLRIFIVFVIIVHPSVKLLSRARLPQSGHRATTKVLYMENIALMGFLLAQTELIDRNPAKLLFSFAISGRRRLSGLPIPARRI
jgi:hypothetical protein